MMSENESIKRRTIWSSACGGGGGGSNPAVSRLRVIAELNQAIREAEDELDGGGALGSSKIVATAAVALLGRERLRERFEELGQLLIDDAEHASRDVGGTHPLVGDLDE